jgi:hypothetical protein
MTATCTDDPQVYAEHASDLLNANELSAHCLLVALAESTDPGNVPSDELDNRLWVYVTSGSRVVAAAHASPNEGIHVFSNDDQATDHVATALATRLTTAGTLTAEPATAARFAKAWTRLPGHSATLSTHSNTYLVPPDWQPDPNGPPGYQRNATPRELKLLTLWMRLPDYPNPTDSARVALLTARRRLSVWDHDGAAQSMVAWRPVTDTLVWIDSLYTPPPLRRHGTGVALLSATSAKLSSEYEVILDVDKSNIAMGTILSELGWPTRHGYASYSLG